MIRCALGAVAASLIVAGPALLTPSITAAQVARLFPPQALRGEVVGTAPPDVQLSGKPARLAPGARIRNEDNRFEVIGQIAGRKFIVNYMLDGAGQIADLWILRPSEIANQPWPTTAEQAQNWLFDPISQKWTRR